MRRRVGVPVGMTAVAIGVAGAPALGQGGSGGALFGVLTGANELSPQGERGAGDANGRGSATATIDGRRLCYGLTVGNVDAPVAAHIHRGRRNQNGPVVVPLTPSESGDPGASSGCVTVQAALLRQIQRNPQRFYWNVHTREYPQGAVRGQVFVRR